MRLGVVILNVLTEVVVEGKSTYVHSLTFVILCVIYFWSLSFPLFINSSAPLF